MDNFFLYFRNIYCSFFNGVLLIFSNTQQPPLCRSCFFALLLVKWLKPKKKKKMRIYLWFEQGLLIQIWSPMLVTLAAHIHAGGKRINYIFSKSLSLPSYSRYRPPPASKELNYLVVTTCLSMGRCDVESTWQSVHYSKGQTCPEDLYKGHYFALFISWALTLEDVGTDRYQNNVFTRK